MIPRIIETHEPLRGGTRRAAPCSAACSGAISGFMVPTRISESGCVEDQPFDVRRSTNVSPHPLQRFNASTLQRSDRAFTLTELLFVITMIAILAALLLPALGRAIKLSQAAQCINNEHQLARSWLMYANDNQNNLVPNRGLNGASGVNYAGDPRLEPQLQPGGANADWCPGNLHIAADNTPGAKYPGGTIQSWWLMAGLLYPYIKDISIYKCPADLTTVPRGATAFVSPALRTYSMNDWVQPMDAPGYASTPWNGGPVTGYHIYTKLSNMTQPGPSKIFVFIEEAPYSIDDGFFAVDPSETTSWVNSPAVLHGRSSQLAYADGHVEPRRWTDNSMIGERPSTPNGNTDDWPADPTSGDLAWLNSVSTAPNP